MSAPENRDKDEDHAYFILGVLMTFIGASFFTLQASGTQQRLFTAACLLIGVVILSTAPRYMWRFLSICASLIIFGGISIVYGVLVFITGESGGMATHHVPHSVGIYPIVAGAILAMIGFVLRRIYSAFHP